MGHSIKFKWPASLHLSHFASLSIKNHFNAALLLQKGSRKPTVQFYIWCLTSVITCPHLYFTLHFLLLLQSGRSGVEKRLLTCCKKVVYVVALKHTLTFCFKVMYFYKPTAVSKTLLKDTRGSVCSCCYL